MEAIVTVVSPDEGVPILGLKLPVDILLSLLHRNIHVAIKTSKHTCYKMKVTVRRANPSDVVATRSTTDLGSQPLSLA